MGQAGIWRLLWAWGSHLDRPTGDSDLGGRTALNYPGFLCTSALLRLCKALAKRVGTGGVAGVHFQPQGEVLELCDAHSNVPPRSPFKEDLVD